MTTKIKDQYGLGFPTLRSGERCRAGNNLSWDNLDANAYAMNGCTASHNYQGTAPGVPNDSVDLAQAFAAAEACLEGAPHGVRVASCWMSLYISVQNAYGPSGATAITDAGAVMDGYHCPLPDDAGQDPNAACRHWVGRAPDQGPFEHGINGNPDQTRCDHIGEVDRNGDGKIDAADSCQASPVRVSAPRNLRIVQ